MKKTIELSYNEIYIEASLRNRSFAHIEVTHGDILYRVILSHEELDELQEVLNEALHEGS